MKISLFLFTSLLIFVLPACRTTTQFTPEQTIIESEETLAPGGTTAVATAAVDAEPPPSPELPTVINTPITELSTGGEPMPGCRAVSQWFEPDPTVVSRFPAVSDSDWISGPEAAAVTIVEYGDFQ